MLMRVHGNILAIVLLLFIADLTAAQSSQSSVASSIQASKGAQSAQSSTASSANAAEPAKTVNDKNIYKGDALTFPVALNVKRILYEDTGVKESDNKICIPPKTKLRALTDGTAGYVDAVIAKQFMFLSAVDCGFDNENLKDKRKISGLAVRVPAAVIQNAAPNRYGFTYGALFVPYKYHFDGSKEFNGGASVGPYVGYRLDRNSFGFELKGVVFAGASTIQVAEEVDGKQNTQNLAGFSYGLGVIGEVKDSFQLGFVLGKDRVSDSASYVDNGKTWAAFSIGFSFDR